MDKIEGFYVYRWMIDDLHLSGIRLCAYAVIYALYQKGKTFDTGLVHLCAILNCSCRCLIDALTGLVELGLIEKEERYHYGLPNVYRNIYKREKLQPDSATFSPFCCTINNLDSLKEACK